MALQKMFDFLSVPDVICVSMFLQTQQVLSHPGMVENGKSENTLLVDLKM
jgi:hypothetical protein